MLKILLRILLYTCLTAAYLHSVSDTFSSESCEDVLQGCVEVVDSQGETIKQCMELHKEKDELLETSKEATEATAKQLSTVKVERTVGFSLSGLLFLLILL
jgi:hypothetical protein